MLPPLLARFIEKFPQVSLSLFSGNSSEVEKALQEHRIDLALVEGNTRQPNLKYTPFLQDELVAIVHTHSKWMDYDEITLDELKEVPLVLRERGSGTLDVLITALHKHNIKLSDLTIRMHLGEVQRALNYFWKIVSAWGFCLSGLLIKNCIQGSLKYWI